MKKLRESSLFIMIAVVILAVMTINFILPDRIFSENENKYLAQTPMFNWRTLTSGEFARKYETYYNDQFWGRDSWITTKSISEYVLLKTENNGVAYGRDGYLFSKFYSFPADQLVTNLNAIDAFAYNAVSEVSIMVVPTAAYPLISKVPAGLPMVDQGFYISEINNYLSNTVHPVNIKDLLAVSADEYIYFRTDHHWTTYGAWLAYSQFAAENGLVAFDYNHTAPVEISNFLGTHYSKTKAFSVVPDTIAYFEIPVTVQIGEQTYNTLYDYDQFEARDKYAGFLHGNNGFITIETQPDSKKLESILVIGDSYSYNFVPFLTANYCNITVVDPRYYNGSYEELRDVYYDDILLLYGIENICSDTNIIKLSD